MGFQAQTWLEGRGWQLPRGRAETWGVGPGDMESGRASSSLSSRTPGLPDSVPCRWQRMGVEKEGHRGVRASGERPWVSPLQQGRPWSVRGALAGTGTEISTLNPDFWGLPDLGISAWGAPRTAAGVHMPPVYTGPVAVPTGDKHGHMLTHIHVHEHACTHGQGHMHTRAGTRAHMGGDTRTHEQGPRAGTRAHTSGDAHTGAGTRAHVLIAVHP